MLKVRSLHTCSWAAQASLFLAFQAAVSHGLPSQVERTITQAPPIPTKRSEPSSTTNQDFKLWSDAVSLIHQVYPSSSITNVAALSWPSQVVVDGSTIVIKAAPTISSHEATTTPINTQFSSTTLSTPTAVSSTQSPSSSAAASTSSTSASGSHKNTLVIVLGIVCAILGVVIIAGVLWYCYRTWKRHRALADDDSDYESWRSSTNGSQMAEDTSYGQRYENRAIPPIPVDAHRYSQGRSSQDFGTATSDNPFIAAEERRRSSDREAPTQPVTSFRGIERDNWWSPPQNQRHQSLPHLITNPANGPWTPPPKSPRRPSLTTQNCYAQPEAQIFDFGFGNRQYQPKPTTVTRKPVQRIQPIPSGQNWAPRAQFPPMGHSSPRRTSPVPSGGSTPRSTSFANRYSPIQEDEVI